MELLLLSTGGTPYLEHALPEVAVFLGDRRRVGFVTLAELGDETACFAEAARAFARIGVTAVHVRSPDTWRNIDAVMVGGGNTYALLQRLRTEGLMEHIRNAVISGLPYIGASAGMNITGKRIVTTNDWNVVEYAGPYDGFAFVPWTTNPHFIDEQSPLARNRERTSERVAEFHRVRGDPVLGVEERAMVIVRSDTATVHSVTSARVWWKTPNTEAVWYGNGSVLPTRIIPPPNP